METVYKSVLKNNLDEYEKVLISKELSSISIRKYIGDITRFLKYLDYYSITKVNQNVMEQYQLYLNSKCSKRSCNSYFISLNKYFNFLGLSFLHLKLYQFSQKNSLENVLSMEEYQQLLAFTNNKKYERIHILMKTLGCTGIRISELKYITYEALIEKKVDVIAKGKTRTIYLNNDICKKLSDYCKDNNIDSGIIFRTKRSNNPLDQGNIWRELKEIARKCEVDPIKVYPHSFRHLFAKTYIEKFNSIDELADILGHSSIETTRIYTRTTGEEKRERLNLLGL